MIAKPQKLNKSQNWGKVLREERHLKTKRSRENCRIIVQFPGSLTHPQACRIEEKAVTTRVYIRILFPDRLRELRNAQTCQIDLAKILNVSNGKLSSYESGKDFTMSAEKMIVNVRLFGQYVRARISRPE